MEKETSFKDFIGNRFIRAILLSGLFLQLGIWVRNFSVLLFVMEQTNEDPFAVSMISVAEYAPIFIFSIIGGTFADRWKPKRTMVWCDILSAISVFAVLITLIFSSWHVVFFAMLISSILSQFSQPSGMKLFKVHVPEAQLQMGMSIYQTMFALFMIIGPVIGTVVFQQFGIEVSIAITGVMFLFSAVALMFLPADKIMEKTTEQTTVVTEFVQGFKYVLKNKFLTLLGANFFVAGLAIGLIQPLGIFIVTEQLQMNKEVIQWFMAINGVAMIIGGGIALAISKKVKPIRMLAAGMLVNAIMISIMGFSTILWLTLAAQFFAGLMMPAIQISINTMILQNAEESFVGRVNGIMTPLFMGGMVLMMSLAGIVKQLTGLALAYQISSICLIIGVILVMPLVLNRKDQKKDVKVSAKEMG
jgi:predicted MFS family arabinose efflux permease